MRLLTLLALLLISSLHGQQVWRSLEGPPVPFNDIAHGNGVYVGLTDAGLTYVSSDGGETWTMRSLGAARPKDYSDYIDISGIVFDGTRFCVAYSGFSAVSIDGLEWTIMKNDLAESDGLLIHGETGLYIYVHGYGRRSSEAPLTEIHTSEDLINWQISETVDGLFSGIATDGNTLLISLLFRRTSLGPRVENYLSSTDGTNWQLIETNLEEGNGISLLGYARGHYYGQATRRSDGILRSVDGIDWNPVTSSTDAGAAMGKVMTLDEAVLIATEEGFLRSEGGEFFEFHPVPAILGWGVSSTISADGRILISPRIGGSIMISEDGINVRYATDSSAVMTMWEEDDRIHHAPRMGKFKPAMTENGNYLFIASFLRGPLLRLVGPSTSQWQTTSEDLNIHGIGSAGGLIRYNNKLFKKFRLPQL